MSLDSLSLQSKLNLESNGGVLALGSGSVQIQSRLAEVAEKIRDAEKRAGRAAGSTVLIAVSKTKTADAVLAAIQNGIFNFGENYVQEATKKIEKIKTLVDRDVRWHLIGGLQTNKSKFVVGKFETIQSVDRIELAEALNKRAGEAGIVQNILLQVKLGDEPTKGGVTAGACSELIQKIVPLSNLRIEGLMSLPPIENDPEGSRKFFAELRELHARLKSLVPSGSGSFKHLSMGTTHDYTVAIEEGATMVRVGTAIFGAREMGVGV